jgi:hypothetical protein
MSNVDNSRQRRRAYPLEKIGGHIAGALRMTRKPETKDNRRTVVVRLDKVIK